MNPQTNTQLIPNTYIAKPSSGKGKGILVLHAWWGLNDFMRAFCDRLAAEGFIALAPDLYHGKVAATVDEAEKFSDTLEGSDVKEEITRAVERLHTLNGVEGEHIGLVGFSLGAAWALWLASQKNTPVSATVIFYGTRSADYTQSQSAFQFHLAESDPFEPLSGVQETQKSLEAAGKEAEFYIYPGTTHWFFESDRPDAYNGAAAQLAWERTVTFLKKHLGEDR